MVFKFELLDNDSLPKHYILNINSSINTIFECEIFFRKRII
jgi:hypothetical protein